MKKISIICLTYNQEKYLAQTLDSFLNQIVNFDYEIVIFDDASTDSTLSIINHYESRYPDKFRVMIQKENQYSKYGLMYNYERAIFTCDSEYIAYCEGDDYFIDVNKLQKQVDFLDANPNYVMVHTGFKKYRDEKKRYSKYNSTKYVVPTGEIFEKLIVYNYVCAASVMFRTNVGQSALSLLTPISIEKKWLTADYPLWLHLSRVGKIGYIKDITTAYRYHKDSLSSSDNKKLRIDFLWSQKDIKEYFISQAVLDEVTIRRSVGREIKELYSCALKFKLPQEPKLRKMFFEYRDVIDSHKLKLKALFFHYILRKN